ncbi:MAG: DUF922 domain-containing protein [Maribacter sp.]|nr:DUF922 domain-containing protein [Maribacter sp.]
METQEYETIEWSPDYKLTWEDFKGKSPNNDRAAATTASGISYQFSTSALNGEIELDYEVNTFFYPQKSWYQPSLCDSLILSHEQLHFDISELYARKMRSRLASTSFTQNVKAEVKEIYKEVLQELQEFQNLYDDQTNFSRDVDQQLMWNKKVREALHK